MLFTLTLLSVLLSFFGFFSVSFWRWFNLLWSFVILCFTLANVYHSAVSPKEVLTLALATDWVLLFGDCGMSDSFNLLVSFIMPICFVSVWSNAYKPVLLLNLMNLLGIFLNCAFYCYDLLMYYIFFESTLMPMFLMIGIWGASSEKVKAAYYFFLYTLTGSMFLLIGIIFINVALGSTCSLYAALDEKWQYYLWLMFFIAFAVKMPIFPLHIWLPEAHVEAPTVGSVILAALLLKLGGFGYLRFMLPLFNHNVTLFYWPLMVSLCGSSMVLSSLTAMSQLDIKRMVAYSSMTHMNMAVLGVFSNSIQALNGGMAMMISHGFISSAMFLLIGVLYDRYHSRVISHYSGLTSTMPVYSCMLIFASLGNMGFPLTYNFIAEFSVVIGLAKMNIYYSMIASVGILLGAVYTMWMVNRLAFGSISKRYISRFYDLVLRESMMLSLLLTITLIYGFYPFGIDNLVLLDALLLIN